MTIKTSEYERFDIRQMAVGCLHILLGRAIPDFPGSTRSHPSRWVVVSQAQQGPLTPAYRGYFPFKVIWYVWQDVVVPILEDPTNQIVTRSNTSLRVKLNQALLGLGSYEEMIEHIQAALVVKLKETGMVHPDQSVGVSGSVVAPVIPGDPVVQPDTDPLDTGDDLVWPEGHPRLTYPVVDGGT